MADEISFYRAVAMLWARRRLVGGTGLIFAALGVVYALVTPPIFESRATISLKEAGKGDASRFLAQMGGIGGLIASQMGSSSLEKVELILSGYELSERVIRKNNLMPVLFPKAWDSATHSWKSKNPKKIPKLWQGVKLMRENVVSVGIDPRKGFLEVSAVSTDPALAKRFVDMYLEALNEKIRGDIISDADTNRAYLEGQIIATSDPVIQEKIRGMVAFEIEKRMFVTSRAFDVLEPPLVPEEKKAPRRSVIVFASFFAGLFAAVGYLLARELFQKLKAGLAREEAAVTRGRV